MSEYYQLKKEAKKFAKEGSESFFEMAIRLKAIKDRKLFKKDKYKGFNNFIKHELPVSRRTVYNYINIVEHIGTEPFTNNPNFDQSKVIPLFPLLNSKDETIPKEDIKNEVIEYINKGRSTEEVKAKIDTYKEQYNLNKKPSETHYSLFLSDNEISLDGVTVLKFAEEINEETMQLILETLKRNTKIMDAIHESIEQAIEEETIYSDDNSFAISHNEKIVPCNNPSFLTEDQSNNLKEAQ